MLNHQNVLETRVQYINWSVICSSFSSFSSKLPELCNTKMLNNNSFWSCTFQTPEKVLSIVCHPLLLRICFGWLSKRGFGHFENSEQEMNLFWSFHSKISPTSSSLSSLIHFLIVAPFHLFYGIFVQKSSSYFCSNPIQICLKPSKLPPKQLPTFNFWVVTLKGFRAE